MHGNPLGKQRQFALAVNVELSKHRLEMKSRRLVADAYALGGVAGRAALGYDLRDLDLPTGQTGRTCEKLRSFAVESARAFRVEDRRNRGGRMNDILSMAQDGDHKQPEGRTIRGERHQARLPRLERGPEPIIQPPLVRGRCRPKLQGRSMGRGRDPNQRIERTLRSEAHLQHPSVMSEMDHGVATAIEARCATPGFGPQRSAGRHGGRPHIGKPHALKLLRC